MPRTPVDVYRGLIQTRLGDEIKNSISRFVAPFSVIRFIDEPLSAHLSRFISLISRLTAYLDARYVAGRDDLTIAIDVLDQFTSTSKWWILDRRSPGLVLRPRVRNPREFLQETRMVTLGGATQSRIVNAVEKLLAFLVEQKIGDSSVQRLLSKSLESSWYLLSALICRNEGRTSTGEHDFERAYDTIRILLFYTTLDDLRALVASREIATSPTIIKAASVSLAPGFERNITHSVAAYLETQHEEYLAKVSPSKPSASRNVLTNALRFLTQLQGVEREKDRVEEDEYEEFILGSIQQLEQIGISADNLSDEGSVTELFKKLRPADGLNERIDLLVRRIERIMIDASGNRDFLLQNSRFTARLLSLLLLVAAGTKTDSGNLSDSDIKRGLILVHNLLSD